MRMCDSEGRLRPGRTAGVEVPASLVSVEGFVAKSINLSWWVQPVSRARKGMEKERETHQNLESELRQEAGREWAEEAAEDEHLTELMRRRRLNLGDAAREMVDRGQRVRVETGAQTFAGEVVFAGADYAIVERADDVVSIRLDAAIWTIEQIEVGGHEQSGGAATMKAHLTDIASTDESVRLIVGDGRALIGSIDLVAADYLEVNQDSLSVVVPFAQLVAVIRPRARF